MLPWKSRATLTCFPSLLLLRVAIVDLGAAEGFMVVEIEEACGGDVELSPRSAERDERCRPTAEIGRLKASSKLTIALDDMVVLS